MIFKQLFDQKSSTYTYLIASSKGREALIIYPVLENVSDYIILLNGDVTLLLDEDEVRLKPFNVVVQRGTNHAWINNGSEPALFIAVLIDADITE